MTMVTIQIKGMHCTSCETLVKDALEGLEGVNAEVSYSKGEAIISFDEKKVKEEQLRSIIAKEGYEV